MCFGCVVYALFCVVLVGGLLFVSFRGFLIDVMLVGWVCWVLFIDLTSFDCFVLVGFSSWCLTDLRDCFAFGLETLRVMLCVVL